ncbi:MAG: hypothetical protein R3C26_22225 [Calditrichia bacterium]
MPASSGWLGGSHQRKNFDGRHVTGRSGQFCRFAGKDSRILEIIRNINHRPSEIAATAERAMLRTLEGGCHVPIGAFAQVSGSNCTSADALPVWMAAGYCAQKWTHLSQMQNIPDLHWLRNC